jgi:ribosomal protein S18 acetylase RimI-like enzyme
MSLMQEHAPLTFSVRDFRSADIARLHEIDAACFEPGIAYTRAELACYIRQSRSVVRIAEHLGQAVAFAIGRVEDGPYGHVITLDVLPHVRCGGIGTALLRLIHDEFRGAGSVLAVLEVDVRNGSAQSFYEKFGYERVETLRGYYGGARDAYRMVCFL